MVKKLQVFMSGANLCTHTLVHEVKNTLCVTYSVESNVFSNSDIKGED